MVQPTHRLDEEKRGENLLWPLFVEHYRKLVAYLMRRFRLCQEDARDIAQEAFFLALRAMHRYRGGNLVSLIYTIARHLALNRGRHEMVRSQVEVDLPQEDLPDTSKGLWTRRAPPNPEEGLVIRETMRRLKEAILELPEIDRQCLLLRMAGLSHREIAATLGLSEDAVKARLKRARKTLRIKLGEDLEGLD